MSRLGKLPITIPAGVTCTPKANEVAFKGPKGEFVQPLPPHVKVALEGSTLTVAIAETSSSETRALWGLARQLLANAVTGVSAGFTKKLELSGIGFKAQVEGKDLVMSLGFSHPVRFAIPEDITIAVEKNNAITVAGVSKQQVGQVAAEIRSLKKPEPYKGKGIKYADETIRRKAGKVVKAAGAK
jgi:large subunit ribosomal protein L6